MLVPWYSAPMSRTSEPHRQIERVQTGVRLERRLLGVLKSLAELNNMSLGDLIEGIVLHAFEGKQAFSTESLAKIRSLRQVFGLDLRAEDSHLLVEQRTSARRGNGNGNGGNGNHGHGK